LRIEREVLLIDALVRTGIALPKRILEGLH